MPVDVSFSAGWYGMRLAPRSLVAQGEAEVGGGRHDGLRRGRLLRLLGLPERGLLWMRGQFRLGCQLVPRAKWHGARLESLPKKTRICFEFKMTGNVTADTTAFEARCFESRDYLNEEI